MLNDAKAYIPEVKWGRTPIALKATAGLRLLPEEMSNNILNEVSYFIDLANTYLLA